VTSKDTEDKSQSSENGFTLIKDNEPFSKEEKNILNKVKVSVISDDFNEALNQIDRINLVEFQNISFKREVLQTKAKCYNKLGKNLELNDIYNELLKLDPLNISLLIKISENQKNIEDKLKYIDRAIEADPYISKLYHKKAEVLYDTYRSRLNKDDSIYFEDIVSLLNKSLDVYPCISNMSWYLKFNVLSSYKTAKEELLKYTKDTIELLEKQDAYFPNLVSLKINLFKIQNKKKDFIYSYLTETLEKIKHTSYVNEIEFILLKEYKKNNDKKLLKERMTLIESEFIVDRDYLELKAEILTQKFGEVDEAITTLESITNKGESTYEKLFDIYLLKNNIEKAQHIYDEHLTEDLNRGVELLITNNNFDDALDLIEKSINETSEQYSFVMNKSYLLLKMKEYDKARVYTNEKLKPKFLDPILLVNYWIAMDKCQRSYKEKIEEKIFNQQDCKDIEKFAAYVLLGDNQKALSMLKSAINKNYEYKYKVPQWPIYTEYLRNDKKFEELLILN